MDPGSYAGAAGVGGGRRRKGADEDEMALLMEVACRINELLFCVNESHTVVQ